MFLRSTNRNKDGKDHRYFSIVENRRVPDGRTVQRTVLYLGEINDQQQAAGRKTLEVFDEQEQRYTSMSLFPDDREIPADALDSVQVKLSGLELRRPRTYGNCWLACELWHELGLDQFWRERLGAGREAVSWEKVLELLVVNRLIEPGSEFRLHRQWFEGSAMDELLQADFMVAEKDRVYRCLDRLLEHKQDLFIWLKQKWADLFGADFEVLLYDLTSTYFEGDMSQNPKARRGYKPGWTQRLCTVGDCAGGDAGWISAGLRGDERQHVRPRDAAFVSETDRGHLRQSAASVGDGSWHSQRSHSEREARTRAADLLPGGHAQRQDQPA